MRQSFKILKISPDKKLLNQGNLLVGVSFEQSGITLTPFRELTEIELQNDQVQLT